MSIQEAGTFVCYQHGHLGIPRLCPPILKDVLLRCWNYDAESRPNIDTLCSVFQRLTMEPSLLVQHSESLSNLLKNDNLVLDIEQNEVSPLATGDNVISQDDLKNHNFCAGKLISNYSRMDFFMP